MTQKLKAYIGFAIKAGKVTFGAENIQEYGRGKGIIIYDIALADSSKQKLLRYAEQKSLTAVQVDNVGEITSRPNCKAIQINDKQLDIALRTELATT